jgi:hypothetical protein
LEKRKGEREGEREVGRREREGEREREVPEFVISIPKRFTNICRSFRSFITFFSRSTKQSIQSNLCHPTFVREEEEAGERREDEGGGRPCKARILYWGEKCSRFNAFSANSYSPK